MNILFTCAGRRNYLLQYFRKVLDNKSKIMAADMQLSAPAMTEADKAFVVPDVYSPDYIANLLEICKTEKVSAIVPLNDLELPVLAGARDKFFNLGTRLIVSDQNVIETCFDKYKTTLFCKQLRIKFPKTFLSLSEAKEAIGKKLAEFPIVVKPRWGSASIGLEFPGTMEELELAYHLVTLKISKSIFYEASRKVPDQAVIIQEKIDGTEYGLDILNNFSGKPVATYVKEKLAMRAGETDKAVLRHKPDLEEIGFKIGNALGHIGNLDCDIFEMNGEYILIEMNPRFGGGYPFSHQAGADYPAAICSWIEDRYFDIESFSREYDQPYAKCDNLIRLLK
jgi:carbamoyl-phosphate synthase large subunit